MTPVEERLKRRIALTGPISIAEFMAACVSDPDGYYARQDPFGTGGDFVTAPEISQMFGELVGAWLLDRWHQDGAPHPVDLVELGPGRGTLMADVLRVLQRDARFLGASRVVLVEASDRLKQRQRTLLAPLHPRVTFADALPEERTIYLIANEFFDALPIRQFVRQDHRWFERTVGLKDGELTFGLSPFPAPVAGEAPEGTVKEICAAGEGFAQAIGARIAGERRGAALIIDYGYADAAGADTLQAVRAHRHADVLSAPGQTDLSAHVNFSALAERASRAGAFVHGPVGQGAFLVALGLLERAGQLGRDADEISRGAISDAVNRLAGSGEGEMGVLFKAMAVTAQEAPPTGFAPRG
ncbi:MAG: SAM-dependent methyltransferase [Pseudomonadota bacterium]